MILSCTMIFEGGDRNHRDPPRSTRPYPWPHAKLACFVDTERVLVEESNATYRSIMSIVSRDQLLAFDVKGTCGSIARSVIKIFPSMLQFIAKMASA